MGILIGPIRISTGRTIDDEQCGSREGRGCVDKIFTVRQMCDKQGNIYDIYGFGESI